MVKKMLVVCWANTVWMGDSDVHLPAALGVWACMLAAFCWASKSTAAVSSSIWRHICVCVFVTALFFRLGLGATACSSSSGLSFSFVSSCASLICESLHNMTLDFNLYLFILFSFGLFPPFSSAMLCSSLSPSDLHCHGRALGSILSMSCCALSVVAPRRH